LVPFFLIKRRIAGPVEIFLNLRTLVGAFVCFFFLGGMVETETGIGKGFGKCGLLGEIMDSVLGGRESIAERSLNKLWVAPRQELRSQ
jgi:hypothetical protein